MVGRCGISLRRSDTSKAFFGGGSVFERKSDSLDLFVVQRDGPMVATNTEQRYEQKKKRMRERKEGRGMGGLERKRNTVVEQRRKKERKKDGMNRSIC